MKVANGNGKRLKVETKNSFYTVQVLVLVENQASCHVQAGALAGLVGWVESDLECCNVLIGQ